MSMKYNDFPFTTITTQALILLLYNWHLSIFSFHWTKVVACLDFLLVSQEEAMRWSWHAPWSNSVSRTCLPAAESVCLEHGSYSRLGHVSIFLVYSNRGNIKKEDGLLWSPVWLLNKKRENICKCWVRFPSPFCELSKWKQESCIHSSLDMRPCAQGQTEFFGGREREGGNMLLQCCNIIPGSLQVPQDPVQRELCPKLLLTEALSPVSSICWEGQRSALTLWEAGQLPLPTSNTWLPNSPLLTQAKLMWKSVWSIPLMPSVGGLVLGDQNNYWLGSGSQENNNVFSLLSAVTLASGLRLLHCTWDVTSLAADLNQQQCRPPGGEEWKGYKRFY